MFGIRLRRLCLSAAATTFGLGMVGPAKVGVSAHSVDAASRPAFDPRQVVPPESSMLRAALDYRRDGDLEAARASAVAGLNSAPFEQHFLLRWVAADCAYRQGELDEAAELLLPVALSHHPLSAWARLRTSEWLEVREPGRALALLDASLLPSSELDGFPARSLAERARARVLAKLGRRDEAVATLERLLAKTSGKRAAAGVIMPLAELLKEGGEADRVRALGLYRRVVQGQPGTTAERRAEEAIAEILQGLPAPLRKSLREPAPEEKLLRADALLAGYKYRDAARAYAALEAALEDDPEQRCRARYGRARALISGRKRGPGSAMMADVAERCESDPDRRAWARYYAGRAYSALGKNEEAIAQYEALEKEAPAHRLADDALFRAAKVARDMGDADGVVARLSALPGRYPNGDMRPRARFALALDAYERGDLDAAIDTLTADLEDGPGEDLQGRARYFRARFLASAGRRAEAVEAYVDAYRATPLTYYGQKAWSRLSTLDPARAQTEAYGAAQKVPATLTFPYRAAHRHPAFRRAVALFSVEEHSLALRELRNNGFLSKGADPELTWLSGQLMILTGQPYQALSLLRSRMPDLLRLPPQGRNVLLYRLAYPNAFEELIEQAAAREGVPSAFVRAVAREESGFFPRARSRVNAIGLVQLMPATARLIAKSGVRKPHDIASLMRPEVNLALGVHFMATLAKNAGGQFGLVPPAYNAGPGALARWLDERPEEPFDIWVEHIPYDETRTYTRRVLQTYGVYHWLASGRPLSLPATLPDRG